MPTGRPTGRPKGGKLRLCEKVMAKCWADPDFRRRFASRPAALLRKEGVDVPKGTRVTVIEGPEIPAKRGGKDMFFFLPSPPQEITPAKGIIRKNKITLAWNCFEGDGIIVCFGRPEIVD